MEHAAYLLRLGREDLLGREHAESLLALQLVQLRLDKLLDAIIKDFSHLLHRLDLLLCNGPQTRDVLPSIQFEFICVLNIFVEVFNHVGHLVSESLRILS